MTNFVFEAAVPKYVTLTMQLLNLTLIWEFSGRQMMFPGCNAVLTYAMRLRFESVRLVMIKQIIFWGQSMFEDSGLQMEAPR